MRVLLVEDDALIADGLMVMLSHEGYAVDHLENGQQALQALNTETFDLLILDLGLPGLDGIQVLQALRAGNGKNVNVPVLILTARDALDDRIQGLDHGADDYMVKPFDISELIARARALLRRSKGRARSVIEYKDLVIDPSAHTVTYQSKPVSLLPKELAVLTTLLENKGKVVSKSRLEESLYAWGDELGSNALEVYVHHLRKKITNDLIKTIRGVGYLVPGDDV